MSAHPKHIRIEEYDYQLPDDRIARHPLPERDSAQLLVYRKGTITSDQYTNISNHVPPQSFLVFNQTKVIHARLHFKKTTGGVIEVFCLEPHNRYPDVQAAMSATGEVWWRCMIGGASKWKHGMVLEQSFPVSHLTLRAEIAERDPGAFTVAFSWSADRQLSFAEVLQIAGEVPLPPYLHRAPEAEDETRYQTVYAREEGSVAAPTAGLHFTNRIFNSLQEKDIRSGFVTLHVGAGTFKPVSSGTIADHEMHAEWIDVNVELIQQLLLHLHKGVVAVGTTSLRTLESLYWIGVKLLNHVVPPEGGIAVTQWEPYETKNSDVDPAAALQAVLDWLLASHQDRLITRTQILIAPGYRFRIVRGLVTNFHQPRSTLLLLVAALIGEDWHKVYDYALAHEYRFLSFGDGSLLWAE